MIDKKIREAYRDVDVPDLKAGILAAVAAKESKRVHRKIRPAAAVLLSAVFLTMLMSAAAAGSLMVPTTCRWVLPSSMVAFSCISAMEPMVWVWPHLQTQTGRGVPQ